VAGFVTALHTQSWFDIDPSEPLTASQVKDIQRLWFRHGGLMDDDNAFIPETRFWEFARALAQQVARDLRAGTAEEEANRAHLIWLGKRP
jgi:hypothetical protein